MKPKEDSPQYWNSLALEIFDELKVEADAIMDGLAQDGYAPGEVPLSIDVLKKMLPADALGAIQRDIQNPHRAKNAVSIFGQYLNHLERQALLVGGGSSPATIPKVSV